MSKKLTPWFPPEIKPVHVGFYEIKYDDDDDESISYFDGNDWYAATTPEFLGIRQVDCRPCFKYFPCFNWRGLAEKPE